MKHDARLTVVLLAAAALVLLGAKCSLFNKAPAVPTVTGPTEGVAGVAVTFTATTTDPDGDSVSVMFDWGDNSTLAWTAFLASGAACTTQHTYADSGTFAVKAKAKDRSGKESGWTGGLAVNLLPGGTDYLDTIIGSIPIPYSYSQLVMSPAGDYAYALLDDTNGILPVRLSTRSAEAVIPLPAHPMNAVVSPDGGHVYLASYSGHCVISVRTSDRVVEATSPFSGSPYEIAVSTDGGSVLVTDAVPGALVVLRASDLTPTDTIAVPLKWVTGSRGDGTFFGVTFTSTLRLNLGTGAAEDSLTGMTPGGVVVSPDWRVLYVVDQSESGYVVIEADDFASHQVVNAHTYGVGGLGISPDGAQLYYTDGHALRVVDTRNQTLLHSIPCPTKAPFAVHPSGDSLYLFDNARRVDIVGKRQQY